MPDLRRRDLAAEAAAEAKARGEAGEDCDADLDQTLDASILRATAKEAAGNSTPCRPPPAGRPGWADGSEMVFLEASPDRRSSEVRGRSRED